MQVTGQIIMHAAPFFLLLILAEILLLRQARRPVIGKRDFFADVVIALGASLVSLLTNGIILFLYCQIYRYRLFDIGPASWWGWLACFLADDLSWYVFHRCSHRIRFFWASHVVHHSPEIFSLSGGMRVPWTANLTGNFLFWAWMPLIGIEPVMIIVMKSVSIIYQFWLHTELIRKMPRWFEFVFNTPSHHRVHHASNIAYLDKNHGGFLIIWDRIFGTFEKEDEPARYGLTKKLKSRNPFTIALHEWGNLFGDLKRARKPLDIFNYLFNAPGWSPDGCSLTTHQLRALEQKQESSRQQGKEVLYRRDSGDKFPKQDNARFHQQAGKQEKITGTGGGSGHLIPLPHHFVQYHSRGHRYI